MTLGSGLIYFILYDPDYVSPRSGSTLVIYDSSKPKHWIFIVLDGSNHIYNYRSPQDWIGLTLFIDGFGGIAVAHFRIFSSFTDRVRVDVSLRSLR